MRRLLTTVLVVLATVVILVQTASGQSISFRIVVPDSAGVNPVSPGAVYDPVHRKVFFAGVGAVGVLDGPDGRRVHRIDVAGAPNEGSHGLFIDTALCKIYSVPRYDSVITVIDTRAESVIATMVAPHGVISDGYDQACLNTVDHKLYVRTDHGLARFNTRSDSFTGYIDPAGSYIKDMCFNPDADKYYFTTEGNNVAVCDGAADTLIALLFAGTGAPMLPKYVSLVGKVYIPNLMGGLLTVVDGWGDTLLAPVLTPGAPAIGAVNETDGKLYVQHFGSGLYSVVDCRSDSVRTALALYEPGGSTWNAGNDRAYLSADDRILAVDGRTDSIVRVLLRPMDAHRGVSNPGRNIAYLTSSPSGQLVAIDGATDSVMWLDYSGRDFDSRQWSPRYRTLYTTGRDQWAVTATPIVPGVTSKTAWLPGGDHGDGSRDMLLLSDVRDKLYSFGPRREVQPCLAYVIERNAMIVVDSFMLSGNPVAGLLLDGVGRAYIGVIQPDSGASSRLAVDVIDLDTDSVIVSLPTGNQLTGGVYSQTSSKVYWPSAESVVVVDVAHDSLLRSVRVTTNDREHVVALAWDETHDRVYVATTDPSYRLKFIDCSTDSVVASIGGLPVATGLVYCAPARRLYYYSGNGLWSIDCDRNVLTARITEPMLASDVSPVYNPRGNKLFFATNGGGGQIPRPCRVAAVDCATDRIVNWTEIGPKIHCLAVDPDSGLVIACADNSVMYVIRDSAAAVVEGESPPKDRVTLGVEPNPAYGGATIRAYIPQTRRVSLSVYDRVGRQVVVLADAEAGPGKWEMRWDGTDGRTRVPAGVYVVRLEAGRTRLSRKFVLTR